MTPGQVLRDARESKNLSQQEVAALSKLRLEYYQQIEEDEMPAVHSRTYVKIGDVLGISLEMILGKEELKPNQKLEDDIPEEYVWLVRNTLRLVITFGTLLLLTGIVVVFGAILNLFLRMLST